MIDWDARKDEAIAELCRIWKDENPRLAALMERCDVICTDASPARQAIFNALELQMVEYAEAELDEYLAEWAEADAEAADPYGYRGLSRSDF